MKDTVIEMLGAQPSTSGLSPEHIQAVAGCAQALSLAPGEYLWRQGERSGFLYLIQSGQIALEISVPGQGPIRVDTVTDGQLLGCGNLLEASECHFDARALTDVDCLAIQGEPLRRLMENDQKLGYELLKRMAPMMAHKLEAARLRLLEGNGLDHLRGIKRRPLS